jgi:hypothetical protein
LARQPFVHGLVRSLQRAVDRRRCRLEDVSGLTGRETEDVAEDQYRPLPCRQVLQCRDEGELDRFALLVPGLWTG